MSDHDIQKIAAMIKDLRTAMLTSVDPSGKLLARPMSTQDVEFDGDLWFIAERDSEQTRAITANPQVNVSYTGKGTWVSVSGRARVLEDPTKLHEYWNTFTDLFMEGGPDNPNNILLHIEADSAEYWGGNDNGTGGRIGQLMHIVRSAVTGRRTEGRNDTVDLP
ncbi:pyridoxamine 5'-phosphate oxidase family protein [Austwickia chelonae]|uniref:pyridoxamine 5'-phosphate oxidase family protein n=1 Tax=Austwickia chelonae TaxID=100225 RepID=UPI000E2495E3|nr:pyridoxamine 5'-phosphate oxidase family protein [Austwickia chelonae]